MLTLVRSNLSKDLASFFQIESEKILNLLEKPKDPQHGQLSLPLFVFAKEFKKNPAVLAQEWVQKLSQQAPEYIDKSVAVSGFVNFYFKADFLFKSLLDFVKDEKTIGFSKEGHTQEGRKRTLVIDYSSPNVAKPMHIGHLRATMIGQALRNLAESQGYQVIGLNHLGDWGSQFGKLAWAYQKWGHEYDFKDNAFESLYALYVRFHAEAELHPEYEELGAQTFKKLEDSDPEIVALWKMFIEISMKDFERLWRRLGVVHDLVRGESFYNDRLQSVEEILKAKGLLVESEGALVVPLDEFDMPPCLIRKTDGASLYATRDIASAIYRKNELKADINLYVVGVDQNLHFKQVFKVLEKLGFEWAKDCHHISFGLVRFKDGTKISSRKGQIIRFSDVLDKAVDLVKGIIQEKNPHLNDKDKVAEKVALGGVIFGDLVNDRVKNVEFDWDRVLSFEGDSGPYLQYCYVRCSSLLKKYDQHVDMSFHQALKEKEEIELIQKLLEFEITLKNSFQQYKPSLLAHYLLEMSLAFNRFYQNHRILSGDPQWVVPRMQLVRATQAVLGQGLRLLNIPLLDEM